MPHPKNRSYFPLRRQLPEHKQLTRKQLSKVKRVLAKHGRKLPKPGYCVNATKIGGKFTKEYFVGNSSISLVEICHEIYGGKHTYMMRSKPARSRR